MNFTRVAEALVIGYSQYFGKLAGSRVGKYAAVSFRPSAKGFSLATHSFAMVYYPSDEQYAPERELEPVRHHEVVIRIIPDGEP